MEGVDGRVFLLQLLGYSRLVASLGHRACA